MATSRASAASAMPPSPSWPLRPTGDAWSNVLSGLKLCRGVFGFWLSLSSFKSWSGSLRLFDAGRCWQVPTPPPVGLDRFLSSHQVFVCRAAGGSVLRQGIRAIAGVRYSSRMRASPSGQIEYTLPRKSLKSALGPELFRVGIAFDVAQLESVRSRAFCPRV